MLLDEFTTTTQKLKEKTEDNVNRFVEVAMLLPAVPEKIKSWTRPTLISEISR